MSSPGTGTGMYRSINVDDEEEQLWIGSYDSIGSMAVARPPGGTDPVYDHLAEPEYIKKEKGFQESRDFIAQSHNSPGPTPLPMGKMVVISLIFFCNFFSTTCLFPFMAFMVRDFGVTDDDSQIGYYVGALASTFNLGQFMSGYFWGSLSDRIGRRPTILIAFGGAVVTITAFGFSPSYAFAVGCRFILGLVNGTVGVARTCIREVTDESNQAKGFSIIGLTWGIALIAGPASTGLLADPKQLDDSFRGTIFDKYPYSLPCLVAAVVNISGFCITYFFLEETSSAAKKQHRGKKEHTVAEPLLEGTNNTINGDQGAGGSAVLTASTTSTTAPAPTPKRWWQQGSHFRYLWSDSIVRSVCLLYAYKALIYIVYDEIFPLWALTATEDGGLGFIQRDIGVTLATGGASLILFQVLIYPRIAKKAGLKTSFMLGTLLLCPIFMMTPMLELSNGSSKEVKWTAVLVVMVFRSILGWQTMTSILVMISNSAPGDMGGAAAGLSQSLVSLARTGGPPVFGVLFAWSAGNKGNFPFDYHFVFLLLGVSNLILLILVGLLPKNRVERRVETVQVASQGRGAPSPRMGDKHGLRAGKLDEDHYQAL